MAGGDGEKIRGKGRRNDVMERSEHEERGGGRGGGGGEK